MPPESAFINSRSIPPRRTRAGARRKTKTAAWATDEPVFYLDKEQPILPPQKISADMAPPENLEAVLAEALPDRQAGDPLTQLVFSNISPQHTPAQSTLAEFEEDPLTQAIFGWREEGLSSKQTPLQPRVAKEASRETILAELADIEREDSKLARRIIRVSPPRRQSKFALLSDKSFKAPRSYQSQDEANRWRAESDWFQVGLAQEKSPRAGIQGGFKKSQWKIFLVGLAAVLLPLSLGLVAFQFFFKSNLPSAFERKLLGSSSFTLVNTHASENFPYLVELKKRISPASNSEVSAATVVPLDSFLEHNSEFAWLNIFKKKALTPSAFFLTNITLLDQLKPVLIKSSAAELSEYIAWLKFWQDLVSPGRQYLVVVANPEISRPVGGLPVSYALIKITDDGLETASAGQFSGLDAAVNSKVIPPLAIQAFNTAWTPREAGWFLDFNESAQTLLNFFEGLTQTKPDGLVFITKDVLGELSFRGGLVFDFESSDWFENFREALTQKSNPKWLALAAILKKSLAGHKLQFYFDRPRLADYVADSGWAIALPKEDQPDALGLGLVTFKGNSPQLEFLEYKNKVFEDGSMVVKLNLLFHQLAVSASKTYLKVYLPQQSQVLKVTGLSAREKLPDFDYSASGFKADPRLVSPQQIANSPSADFFGESGFVVVAGWLSLNLQERNTISLEYVLPLKLNRQAAFSNYRFKLWRPHGVQNTPFRFSLVVPKTAQVLSLEPAGFVTTQLAEYQGNLSQDITLDASLRFND